MCAVAIDKKRVRFIMDRDEAATRKQIDDKNRDVSLEEILQNHRLS